MEYNGLYTALLLMRLSNGEYIPMPSVQASYGPFSSLSEAKADLIDTFKAISNVPRGYTFCVIENDRPQEYWFTKAGDWTSIEKKGGFSGSGNIVSGLMIEARDGYLKISYDGGESWTPLVSLDALKGNTGSPGKDGKDAVSDLSKIQIRMSTRIVYGGDSDDEPYNEYVLEYTRNGGVNWITIGTIRSGSGGVGGSHVITIETYVDGNQYWKQDGNWMLDDQGNMVRANGKDGLDGADGAGFYTQFKSIIFKRSNNTRIVNGEELLEESEYPHGGTYNNPVPPSGDWFDGVPPGTEKLWMSTRWFSTNEAITDANDWSIPAPATDTADMDFEYSNAPLNTTPNGPGINKNINIYNSSTNPNGWYDADETVLYNGNALLANANWMAMRICKNGVWGSWKVFKIRGEAGEDGVVPVVQFTSVVFRRSDNTRVDGNTVKLAAEEYPTGGSYESPVPTNRDNSNHPLWSDGIPAGSAKLWMSTRVFYSDNSASSWEEPVAVGDTNAMDFEWCDEETPTYPYPTRTSPDDNNSGKQLDDTWYDEPNPESDPIWMAMRPVSGNVYDSTYWQVIRVKGERGTDGTSFVPKGQLFGIFDTEQAARAYFRSNYTRLESKKFAIVGANLEKLYIYSSASPNSAGTRVDDIAIGDSYVNSVGAGKYEKTAGDLKEHVFIWDGDNFVDFGCIQGPEGVGTYFHVKYSNDAGYSFTMSGEVQDGETPGDYIGVRIDHVAADSMNPNDYTWSKFKGEDGFGYEYIFKLTSTDTPPDVPSLEDCVDYTANPGTQDARTVTYQDDDYVPSFLGWTDDPGSPTKALPYCWVAYRRKVNGRWEEYRGGSGDSARGALFSMYSSKGRGIDHITEMYAIGSSNTDAPALNEFHNYVPAFDLSRGLIYLWNYEEISYDDSTVQTTDPQCIAVSERGRGIASIQEFYYACDFDNPAANNLQTHLPQWGGANRSSSWKTRPMNVDKTNPYLWNFELITFTDGTQTWTDPVIIAYYIYTDVEYLFNVFKKVEGDSDRAYLGGLLGVVEKDSQNNDVVRAMLNASNIGKSSEYGKLFIASGMNGAQDPESATFKVFENGRVEMRDAVIRGFFQQYYKNQNNVVKDPTAVSFQSVDKAKASNHIMLGWEGLLPAEIKSNIIHLSTTVGGVSALNFDLPAGRVVFTNQMYIKDNGTLYFNKEHKRTQIQGHFLFPSGALVRNSTINLYGGWVEISKFSAIDNDRNEVNPQISDYAQTYMVHSWGGSVALPAQAISAPIVNAAGAVVGKETSDELSSRRFISDTDVVARINVENRYIFVNGNNSSDPLYIVMPRLYNSLLNSADYPTPIEYYIEISMGREIKFKVNNVGNTFDDADVDDLEDLYVKHTAGIAQLTCPARTGAFEHNRLLRLTYIPYSGGVGNCGWIAEMVNRISEIPATV